MKNLIHQKFDDDLRQENYHTTTNPRSFRKWILIELNECCLACMHRYGKHKNGSGWKNHRKTQYKNKNYNDNKS